jgi:acyl-CoA thioesterase FadM
MIRFDYQVLDTETGGCLVTGFTTHICLNDQGKPTRIPEDWERFWSSLIVKA